MDSFDNWGFLAVGQFHRYSNARLRILGCSSRKLAVLLERKNIPTSSTFPSGRTKQLSGPKWCVYERVREDGQELVRPKPVVLQLVHSYYTIIGTMTMTIPP